MRSALKMCLPLALGVVLGGCWLLPKPVPKATPIKFPREDISDGTKREPRRVGAVLMVNSEGKFVLIETESSTGLPQGVALKTFRSGAETGVLAVSGERRGTVITADIVRGEPARGDDVMQ